MFSRAKPVFSKRRMFSSGSTNRGTYGLTAPTTPKAPSLKFELISIGYYPPYTLVEVRYEEAETFNGHKLLVYQDNVVDKIRSCKVLDPHFLETGLVPVMRLNPKTGRDFFNKLRG